MPALTTERRMIPTGFCQKAPLSDFGVKIRDDGIVFKADRKGIHIPAHRIALSYHSLYFSKNFSLNPKNLSSKIASRMVLTR